MPKCETALRMKYELELEEFYCKLRTEEQNEKKNLLSWTPKLGGRPLNEAEKDFIVQERKSRLEKYKEITEEKQFFEPGKYDDTLIIPPDMAPAPSGTFTPEISEDWIFRQIYLNKFIQAARKIIIKARLEKRLRKLTEYTRAVEHTVLEMVPMPMAPDLVATSHVDVPKKNFNVDLLPNLDLRKSAKVHPIERPKCDFTFQPLDSTESSAPLGTGLEYRNMTLFEVNFMSVKPLEKFEMKRYNDEDLFTFNKNESNSEAMKKKKQESSKEKESQQDKKKSEEGNSCMVSNQPTLVELLHKSNIQGISMVKCDDIQIFDGVIKKSCYSKVKISNCIYNHLVDELPQVSLKKKLSC